MLKHGQIALDPDRPINTLTRAYARYASAVFICGIFLARTLEGIFFGSIPAETFVVATLILLCVAVWTVMCLRQLGEVVAKEGPVKREGEGFWQHLSRSGALANVNQGFWMFLLLGMILGILNRMWQLYVAGGGASFGGVTDVVVAGSFIVAVIVGLCIAQYWAKGRTNAPG